jgi:LCP family protein required for cell wall assembly
VTEVTDATEVIEATEVSAEAAAETSNGPAEAAAETSPGPGGAREGAPDEIDSASDLTKSLSGPPFSDCGLRIADCGLRIFIPIPQFALRNSQSGRRGLIRWIATVGGGILYCGYVGLGLVLGVAILSSVTRRADAATVNLPLGVGSISFAGISLPFNTIAEQPLALVPDWKGTERITVLMMGLDQRDDEREIGLPTRTDSMIVVSIDPLLKTAAMISFPRDLWVTIPGFGEDRINTAYRYGELRRVDGGGAGVAARTLDQNFGLRPTYYATVDFRGFQEIVNTLGGVLIDVPRPLKDDEYPTENYGYERVFFAPGPQLMDGATALKYARTRHQDSDFGRMARQQQVLLGIRERALRLNVLPRLPALVEQLARTVNTNFTPGELLSLAKLATQIESAALGTLVVDSQLVTPYVGAEGASLQLPRRDEIRKAIQRATADPRLLREASRVEVASAPGRNQLAQQLAERLSAAGLQVVRRSVLQGAEPEGTRVVTYAEKPRTEQAILGTLGLTQRAVEPGSAEPDIDILVILGRDLLGG